VKKRNFRVSCSPGSAEALVRCGGKIKYILIATIFGINVAKKVGNRTVYVKIIASCKVGTFFETQCSSKRQPKFAALNRERHPYSAARPSHWALAHIASAVLGVLIVSVRPSVRLSHACFVTNP